MWFSVKVERKIVVSVVKNYFKPTCWCGVRRRRCHEYALLASMPTTWHGHLSHLGRIGPQTPEHFVTSPFSRCVIHCSTALILPRVNCALITQLWLSGLVQWTTTGLGTRPDGRAVCNLAMRTLLMEWAAPQFAKLAQFVVQPHWSYLKRECHFHSLSLGCADLPRNLCAGSCGHATGARSDGCTI